MVASAVALKLFTPSYNYLMSYDTLHSINKRGTPNKMVLYIHALLLQRIYNATSASPNWVDLNFQQNFNGRMQMFNVYDASNYKVGKNLPANRLRVLNNKIDLKWLNLSRDSYKVKCTDLFLK